MPPEEFADSASCRTHAGFNVIEWLSSNTNRRGIDGETHIVLRPGRCPDGCVQLTVKLWPWRSLTDIAALRCASTRSSNTSAVWSSP